MPDIVPVSIRMDANTYKKYAAKAEKMHKGNFSECLRHMISMGEKYEGLVNQNMDTLPAWIQDTMAELDAIKTAGALACYTQEGILRLRAAIYLHEDLQKNPNAGHIPRLIEDLKLACVNEAKAKEKAKRKMESQVQQASSKVTE